MKKLRLTLILMVVCAIVGYTIGVGIIYVGGISEGISILSVLGDSTALLIAGGGALVGLLIGVTTKSQEDKNSNTGTTTKGEKTDIAFDSTFISEDRLKNDPELVYCTWNTLPTIKKTGFVFRNKQVGGRYEINMKNETHALVIGTTGTGKTQVLANPTIRILAHSAQKPSMVMTDPKGELYKDNAETLKKEGYKIIVLNLNDPYASSMWNPMETAFKLYQRAGNLTKEVKKVSGTTPQKMGYRTFDDEALNGVKYGDTWYGFENKAFPTLELLKTELESKKIQLEDEAKSDLRNISLALIPDDPNCKDKTWPDGCRDFITGIMYAMLEDSRDPRLGMTLEKFNFYNLYKISMIRDPAGERESMLKTLTSYSDGRDKVHSNVAQLMGSVCLASPVTQRSFLSTLGSSVGKTLGDDGILYMTSGTDINFEELAEKPVAFFIRIPDHKTERHPLGVLCITQLYKTLVDIANKTVNSKGETGSLKRPVYFILDEFGNMPAVPGFGTMVTVARSRKIFFEIILQSYKQLDIKYGPDEAQNIRGNFQMEVFLGSEDPSTIQAFSEACGEITVFHEERSTSRNSKDTSSGENVSISTQRSRKPLLDKQELRQLPKWTVVAKIFRKSIMKDVMTPFYQTTCMEKTKAEDPIAIAKTLKIEDIYYDVNERNRIVLNGSRRNN